MAVYRVRVDKDDNKLFYLLDWNLNSFNSSYTLKLHTRLIEDVKLIFSEIEYIEILMNDSVIAEFSAFNTYSSITYTSTYSKIHGDYADCTEVTLERISLVEEMLAIKNALEDKNNLDIDSMSVEEYKQYILAKVAEDCESDIHSGAEVNGEYFTYKAEDQQNLKVLFDTVVTAPQVVGLPYHSSGNPCRLYSREEIVSIYMTLMMRLVRITTYCNALNMMIKDMETKEELNEVVYGMPLSEDRLASYNEIIESTNNSFNSVIASFMGGDNNE